MSRLGDIIRSLVRIAALQHPAAAPIVTQVTTAAQAGEQWVASVRALVTLAQEREDDELMGQLRWIRAAFGRWSESAEHLTGPQLQADLDEVAQELVFAFRKVVVLAVQRRDLNLMAHLGRMQMGFVGWVESLERAPLKEPITINTLRRPTT